MEFEIREAVLEDAEAITSVHFQAWREAYSELMPASIFDAQEADRERRVQIWSQIISGESPFGDERTFVAVADNRIIGWATYGKGRDEDSPYPNELNGLYVLAEAYGTGVAEALLAATIGFDSGAYVWALKDVGRANSFYRKQGFFPDGTEKIFTRDGANLAEARLVREPK